MKKEIINCITIGDIKGIGLELIFSIWLKYKKKTGPFFILGDYNYIKKTLDQYNYSFSLKKIQNLNDTKKYFNNFLPVLDIKSKNPEYNAYDSLVKSKELAKKNLITGIINLPINKNKIISINKNFIDQTNFYGKTKKGNVNILFYDKKIIISPLTSHIPLTSVKKFIKKNFIYNKILILINSLKSDFKILNPVIGVTGLNPHSGENGRIGLEEKKILLPVIKKLKNMGVKISGPYSADGMFNVDNLNKFDCIITMYHDQGLIPFKILSNNEGVNFTSGLDFVRSSPCHGTAYNLVKKNNASEKSLANAIYLTNKIYKNRKNGKKISRAKFLNRP